MGALDGRLSLVTGAGRGIGAAIARALASNGSKVIVTDILEGDALRTAASIRADGADAWGERLNVASADELQQLSEYVAEKYGHVSILVNNAGVGGNSRIGDPESPVEWDKLISVNLSGVFHVTRAFLPSLRETRGCIINIASVVAFTSGFAHAGYTASKGGVRALTQAMCRELAPFGIRVNAIAPGYINTAMAKEDVGIPDDWLKWHCPMARQGEPIEVAEPVVFLASPAASFVNGVTLPVDGGYLTI